MAVIQSPSQTAASARKRGARNYVLRRIGLYLLTVWAAITLAFILFRIMPGDPISILLAQLSILEGKQQVGAENIVATYRAMFGLDDPIYIQYIAFLRNIVTGFDFGPSFVAVPDPGPGADRAPPALDGPAFLDVHARGMDHRHGHRDCRRLDAPHAVGQPDFGVPDAAPGHAGLPDGAGARSSSSVTGLAGCQPANPTTPISSPP